MPEIKTQKMSLGRESMTLYEGDCLELLKSLDHESVDLIITSPPYCIGKTYEKPEDDIETFKRQHILIFPEIYRILKTGGSICWQVGYHVDKGSIVPLDFYVYDIFTSKNQELSIPLVLRNRIVWTFGHGLNSQSRFSGRHELILWFTKGDEYQFDLDAVRIPQKYPGKKSYRGPNKGNLSGNPAGKNPSDVWEATTDVWDIPNVKANHIEKTDHPCQFPVSIPQRLIKALAPRDGVVLDPFMGVGTTGVAAALENRSFAGSELQHDYFQTAQARIKAALEGTIKVREDKPVALPDPNSAVAKLPEEFRLYRETKDSANDDKNES